MDTEHLKNEELLYHTAAAKPLAERIAYLREACRDDPALFARLTALLQSREERGNFLEVPPVGEDVLLDDSLVTESPGTVIGRYKLLEKIGEGGMAVVYMAEQTEPIRRKVALKIIKLGMDTRQVIARFEAERQALALMDHPCIAKVLDAGATEAGRPYFVMELVQGVSITEYCDKNSLSTKDRLKLFLQVCHAVQHAHQKGIIHRDIKPSNVMVTHHDGKPVPKVIDFGIAKATNQKLTEKTLFTRYAHIVGTPAYMSPEQAELSDLDIDTRSDIYSLGVLLYELLTGTTPFSEEELRKAGYIEMQRVIREQEPVKPSTRIRTALRGLGVPPMRVAGILPTLRGQDALATKNKSKGSPTQDTALGSPKTPSPRTGGTPVVLGPQTRTDAFGNPLMGGTPMPREVRGDLDWIVMKTLEKDRTRRYETASGLAEDIRRHLEHEPILARGPGTAYRVQKFLRRNRFRVLAVLALSALAAAGIAAFTLWSQARQQTLQVEAVRQQAVLFQARQQHAEGNREAALETVRPILDSRHFGPEAKLLYATILVERRQADEARVLLEGLLDQPSAIAGAAHALLARLLREGESLDAETLKEIEEHRCQVEALLPKTAEAYFLQAMGALTIKEQLAALNQALTLDPNHYESLRLRAFTHYASRKYELMQEDALDMTYLRRRDPLGHSLRAVALRELGNYGQAIAAYDRALKLVDKKEARCVDWSLQRCETFLRMGDYQRVLAEAGACSHLWPDRPDFQYHGFCALTALGEYEKAQVLFRAIIQRAPTARNEFWFWATKYVFDTLEAERSWHPPGPHPAGAAFLPLVEAEETYRDLSAQAHRVVTNAFTAEWSPDGKKLAFSLGVQGYSGVALYDPATKETELLIVPGKDPRWSPDGKYIAFVRDCQVLRLEELTATERKEQTRRARDEEVWVMNADGTKPRRLARGGWPSWGQDSAHLYFQSRLDEALCSIAIAGPDVEPKRIMTCTSLFPSVSPDNQRVVYLENESLKVRDLASQTVVAQWRVPFDTWSGPAWSPTSKEVCFGAGSGAGDRTGLWIYPLDSNEPVKVLTSQIMAASWAPDGTKLVFALRPPYFELWTADLDPALSTGKTLGPRQTLAEHWQDMLRLYTHRIEADPQDACAYADRARYYDYLHDRANANADIKRWSAVMSGRSPSDGWFGPSHDLRCVLDLPFDCELVFSAERPVNTIPAMSVAFGQKGRCEMKLFEIPMVVTSLVSLCLLSGPEVPPAQAAFTFGEPTNLGPAVNSVDGEIGPYLSPDGLELYLSRGDTAMVARRTTPDSEWDAPSPGLCVTFITSDGLTLYVDSAQADGYGQGDLWMATRPTASDKWGTLVNLGPVVNSASDDFAANVSPDGLELYFTSGRPGGYGGYDLWVAKRATVSDAWGTPSNLGPEVNSSTDENSARISPDGLLLFFASRRSGGYGSGYGLCDIYAARRATSKDPWGPPMNCGPALNSLYIEWMPSLSADGSTLHFHSNRPGGFGGLDIWQAPILPMTDFNSDGKVDEKDLALLVADWGKGNSVCDIGPFAWGDGIVDEKDLGVLMKSLVTPGPSATDMSCDVVLSWTSPSFASTCDVYLGTSQEAVNTASRANPQGVLVSQGQTATTYDPAEPVKLSQAYYWRVDFVIPGPTPTTIKGPVLQFTTAALTYQIKKITATASSIQVGSGPEKTVDGSGLDTSDGHSTDVKDMWWSMAEPSHWIQYEFDRVYTLHEMWVWNMNQIIEPFIGFGAKTVKIEYSADGTTWTPLANVPEFTKAPGKSGYTANTIVSFAGVPAKFVKLTIEKNWGVAQQTGLSEVRFFCIQSAAVPKP